MIHRFLHQFHDNQLLLLAVDTTTNPPRFFSAPPVTEAQGPEYRRWLHEVVVPRLMDLCSLDQKCSLAKVGLKAVTKAIAAT